MNTILITMFIVISLLVYNGIKERVDLVGYIWYIILGGIIGCFLGFFIAVCLPTDYEYKNTTYNLESLQDNNTTKGSFFLGCGSIDGKMKYVFYYENGGFYRMEQLDYELVSIKYSNGKPKYNIVQKVPTKAMINRFGIDLNMYSKTYIFEIPKGSIKNNYNLDAL